MTRYEKNSRVFKRGDLLQLTNGIKNKLKNIGFPDYRINEIKYLKSIDFRPRNKNGSVSYSKSKKESIERIMVDMDVKIGTIDHNTTYWIWKDWVEHYDQI
jgi:hypothetical protein